jgi:hypothetical protein
MSHILRLMRLGWLEVGSQRSNLMSSNRYSLRSCPASGIGNLTWSQGIYEPPGTRDERCVSIRIDYFVCALDSVRL